MQAETTEGLRADQPRADLGGSEGWILRIGSVAGIVGSLLAMVGDLLHPATPIGDPEGVARTIAESEIWVPVHLAIVVGLILMLGGPVAIARSIQEGLLGRWPAWAVVAAGVGSVPVGLVQAFMGESVPFTRTATIVFPTVITLWVVWMSALLLRKRPSASGI